MIPLGYFEGLLASEGANSFDFCSMHPYGALPEQADGSIRALKKLLDSRGKSSVLWQSECGFPSNADTGGWGYGGPWDETKHAKWVLRRLLCDGSLDMKVSIYFILNDYPSIFEAGPRRGELATNRKGLHYAGSWEPKHAAHAYQNLTSLFDDSLQSKPVEAAFQIIQPGSFAGVQPERIRTYALADKKTGSTVLAYWLGVPMQTDATAAKVKLALAAEGIDQPVLVDLLDGRVYQITASGGDNGKLTFENLPLADSPMVLCDRSLVESVPVK